MSLIIGRSGETRVVLPVEAVTQTFALLGMRGSGKTTAAVVLVEEMVAAGQPVVIVDPVGVWYGIRSSADGKEPGLPVVIFGGDHADVPLDEGGGALLAQYLVTARVPAVLDLSRLRKGAQRRFMVDFAETLYHLNRTPLHVVLDEADLFAPQRVPAGAERLLGAIDDLARRGRARGIGLTLISQRPAVVNKDALTQTGTMLAFRLTAPQDRSAIDDWIRAHGTDEQRQELLGSLAGLPVGTAWLSSPGWLQRFERVAIRRRATYDSSQTPEIGAVLQAPQALATIDLATVRAHMAALAAPPPAAKPATRAALAKPVRPAPASSVPEDVARLRQDLAGLRATVQARDEEIAALREKLDAAAARAGLDAKRAQDLRALFGAVHETLLQACAQAKTTVAALQAFFAEADKPGPIVNEAPRATEEGLFRPIAKAPPQPAPEAKPPPEPRAAGDLDKGERAVLTALAQHAPRRLTRNQIAILTGYAPRGGRFGDLLSGLQTRVVEPAFIEGGPAGYGITEAGLLALGPFERLPQGRELGAYWVRRLDKMPGRILGWLIDHPGAQLRTVVAAHLGYQVTGGAFQAALTELRERGLLSPEGKKSVRAAAELLGEAA